MGCAVAGGWGAAGGGVGGGEGGAAGDWLAAVGWAAAGGGGAAGGWAAARGWIAAGGCAAAGGRIAAGGCADAGDAAHQLESMWLDACQVSTIRKYSDRTPPSGRRHGLWINYPRIPSVFRPSDVTRPMSAMAHVLTMVRRLMLEARADG